MAELNEALDQAAEYRKEVASLRSQADTLEAAADALEREWVGVADGDVLSVRDLVRAVQKIRGEHA